MKDELKIQSEQPGQISHFNVHFFSELFLKKQYVRQLTLVPKDRKDPLDEAFLANRHDALSLPFPFSLGTRQERRKQM